METCPSGNPTEDAAKTINKHLVENVNAYASMLDKHMCSCSMPRDRPMVFRRPNRIYEMLVLLFLIAGSVSVLAVGLEPRPIKHNICMVFMVAVTMVVNGYSQYTNAVGIIRRPKSILLAWMGSFGMYICCVLGGISLAQLAQ